MMKRKKLYMILSAVAILLMAGACSPDELVETKKKSGHAVLTLSMPSPEVVNVRSTATEWECNVQELVLLAYRGASTTPVYGASYDVNIDEVLSGNGTNAPKMAFTTDYVPQDGDCLYVFINPYAPISLTQDRSGIDALKWVLPGSLSDFELPMCGSVASWNSQIDNVCVLTRAVAKVELDVSAVTVAGMPFANATSIQYRMAHANAVLYPSDKATLTDAEYSLLPTPDYGEVPIYIPEYSNSTYAGGEGVVPAATAFDSNRCCLLLHVTGGEYTGYYRLDFHKNAVKNSATGGVLAAEEYLDILRNHHYVFRITKVGSNGYASEAEALVNPGSNIEYEVLVEDAGNVSVSNGQYAISSTNDECIIYGNYEDTYTVATVKAVCGNAAFDRITTNSITYEGDIASCNLTALTTTDAELRISFNYSETTNSGKVKIRFGNLEKIIVIERKSTPVDAHPVIVTLPGQLLALSIQESNMANDVKAYDNGNGTYRLCIPENVTPDNMEAVNANPEVEVEPEFGTKRVVCFANTLQAGSNDGKVTRIIVNQTKPEYVGWFGNQGDLNRGALYSYYSKRLLMESVEEKSGMSLFNGVSAIPTAAEVSSIPMEMENGLANTLTMAFSPEYEAAHYCYMKNDRNGNGAIDPDEPEMWYLPAHNQLMAITVCLENVDTKGDMMTGIYRASDRVVDLNPSEGIEQVCWGGWMFQGAIAYIYIQGGAFGSSTLRVRCVRDL